VVGARASPATFVGVERRPRLVAQAWDAALALQSERVSFICADAFELDWGVYDCLYFYNPFEETTFSEPYLIDAALPLGEDVHRYFVKETTQRLAALRPGTRVATYHGFGGRMPRGYQRRASRRVGSGELSLWVKH
jgi:hypothetical protein